MADPTALDLKTLLSLVGTIAAIIGGIIVRDRQVSKRISDGNGKIHLRIDDLKDDVNEHFARKDAVKDSIDRVERSIENLGSELRANHKETISLIVKERG